MTLENRTNTEPINTEWVAAQSRLMKAGLRNKDKETVAVAFSKIAKRFGENIAEEYFVRTVNRMIDEEDFSFV